MNPRIHEADQSTSLVHFISANIESWFE